MLATALLLGPGDPAHSLNPIVAFVGKLQEADDPSFASFNQALGRQWPSNGPKLQLTYHAGAEGPELAVALRAAAAKRPNVLVLPTGAQAQAAKALGIDVPIVFATFVDPRKDGTVASLRTPGGRTTGVMLEDRLDRKRLELLVAALPRVRNVAVLADGAWFVVHGDAVMADDFQRRLGLQLHAHRIETPEALDALMSSAEAATYDAWFIPPSYLAYQAEAKIIAALKRLRRPAMHGSADEVGQGALMAYSQDESFAYDALAELTRRVAFGEDAGTIPVQRPYRYTLTVRIEPDAPWARIEPSVVKRADRVILP
jgi:putative tryptophan/tyrosine transport system substrate-binding protein